MKNIDLQSASQDIYESKYQLKDQKGNPVDKDVDGTYTRVAKALSDVEKPELRTIWNDKFLWALRNGAIPAGRITSNAGAGFYKPATSLVNCVVDDFIFDNMESILDSVKRGGLTLKAGCGIGYDFSTLRPKGAYVAGAGASTSGPLTFMDIFDAMCKTVSSAGGRRGAQMATFDIAHPDIKDFVTAKREDGRLRQFNMSVLITDEFMKAVENDQEWKLAFPANKQEIKDDDFEKVYRKWPITEGYKTNDKNEVACRVYKIISARELWDLIMRSTYDFAEPGFILIDKVNEMNNNFFCEKITKSNPCVTGDTLILTDTGYQRIDYIVGKKTKIWNGFEWSEVTPKITGYDQDILDISFSDGSSLSCTPFHEFVLHDGSKIESKNLNENNKIQKHKFPIIVGEKSLDMDGGYTQGFYSGDGVKVLKARPNRKIIWLYNEKIRLHEKLYYKSKTKTYTNPVGVSICCLTIDKSFKSKKFVPDAEYKVSSRLEWLAGLMDSDGTVSIDGVVGIASIDRDFLLNVKYMLNTLGVTSSLLTGKPEEEKMMPDNKGGEILCTCKESFRIIISATSIVNLVKLGLTTHRLTLEYIPQRDSSRFIRVRSINKRLDKESKVYCFNEEKNHTGIFNGIMTSQCGEQMLPNNGACLLGSVNLTRFIIDPFTPQARFDWEKYRKVIRIFTRMLDNVVEINGLPLEEQRKELERKRRHGMGYLGLGSSIIMLGMTYGDEKSIEFTEQVTKELAITGWEEGVNLAIEKGPAPIMDEFFMANNDMISKRPEMTKLGLRAGDRFSGKVLMASYSKYLNQFPEELKDRIANYGSRFTHHSSIAPTGTISLSLANNASNGIEPSFSHMYSRNIIKEGKKTKEKVDVLSFELLAYRELINPNANPDDKDGPNKLPDNFIDTDSITPKDHINIQAAAQKWIDSSISKTINVPTDYPFEDFKDIYKYAFKKGLKGCTTFRFNPEAFQGVLVKSEDLATTTYRFTMDNGEVIDVKGDETIDYDGENHTAANLFDALKEGYYGKL